MLNIWNDDTHGGCEYVMLYLSLHPQEICADPVNVHAVARHLTGRADGGLTPFATRLLDPKTGHIGHRIFARALSVSTLFEHLMRTRTTGSLVPSSDHALPSAKATQGPLDCMLDVQRNVSWGWV